METLLEEFANLVPEEASPEKSRSVCEEYIKKATKLLQNTQINHSKNIHVLILGFFTQGIAFAPPNGEILANCFYSRSMLHYHLKKYDLCIKDLDLGLKFAKSVALKARLLIKKGESLKALDKKMSKKAFEEARALINSMSHEAIDTKDSLTALLHKTVGKNPQLSQQPVRRVRELPEFQRSDTVPCASKALSLSWDEKWQNHLVANRDIKTGEFLVLEPGYVAVSKVDFRYFCCTHCLKFTWNGIPCDKCTLAIFCSEECKTDSWNKYHDLECTKMYWLLTKHFHRDADVYHMIVRCFIRIQKEKGDEDFVAYVKRQNKFGDENQDKTTRGFTNGKFDSTIIRALLSLGFQIESTLNDLCSKSPSFDSFNPVFLEKIMEIWRDIFKIKLSGMKSPEMTAVVRLASQLAGFIEKKSFRYDGYECTCTDGQHKSDNMFCIHTKGIILAPTLNLMTNSCHPNADRCFKGGMAYAIAIRPIKKGEKISLGWGVPLSLEKPERQEFIRKSFNVECECEVCTENWRAYSTQDQKLSQSTLTQWANKLFKKTGNRNIMKQLGKAFEEFHHTAEILPQVHQAVDEIYARSTTFKASVESYHFKHMCRCWTTPLYEIGLELPDKC